MSASSDRIEVLVARGAAERRALVLSVDEVRANFDRRRLQWRVAGFVAGGLAAAATSAYKLFGKNSLAARLGRYSTAASLLLGVARGILRLRRFF